MINLNDRLRDPSRQQDAYFTGRQGTIWTALPGIVQSFDPVAMTCEVQPAIQGKVRREDGGVDVVNLPLLLDCPVVFPRGGGCSLTFPIKAGDECLVVFSARAIDIWWQQGGVQPPAETRMHDLSDGFVIPGPYSQPLVLPDVSIEAVELRTDDRGARLSIFPNDHLVEVETVGNMVGTVGGTVTVTAGGDVTLTCPKLTVDCPDTTFTGNVTVQGLITGNGGFTVTGGSGVQATCDIALTGAMSSTGDITAGGISLITHTHSGVTPGGGSTGAPL